MEEKINPYLLGMGGAGLDKSPSHIHPLLQAYVGDSVYEVYVRYHLLAIGVVKPNELQKRAIQYVSAVAQAKASRIIESELTEEEADVFRRGRNAKSGSVAKSASVAQYRYSTGLESLIGYLYLSSRQERLEQLMKQIIAACE
ncbi:Mini-ribonuclease 3 [Baia soyae]|uniref:Mini-ribonuclease 3 n=1 Tax=Baia soyae TaxID=1544746 RepID=A0A4R2S8M8_9BACL|nr:ribonuclease III domain-containing protein [Baia soyae]TCP68771.1 ribonuclease-3 family protein [Baia soyae]